MAGDLTWPTAVWPGLLVLQLGLAERPITMVSDLRPDQLLVGDQKLGH